VDFKRHTWEVDEFHGDNEGLVVAEIELDDKNEIFEKPDWLDNEVTSDYRYLNSNLSKSSYKTW
jgi:CYTH domain-containing protein